MPFTINLSNASENRKRQICGSQSGTNCQDGSFSRSLSQSIRTRQHAAEAIHTVYKFHQCETIAARLIGAHFWLPQPQVLLVCDSVARECWPIP